MDTPDSRGRTPSRIQLMTPLSLVLRSLCCLIFFSSLCAWYWVV